MSSSSSAASSSAASGTTTGKKTASRSRAAKDSSSHGAVGSADHDEIALTRAIQNVSKSQAGFVKAVEDFNQVESNVMRELDLRLSNKRKQIDGLDEDFRLTKKTKTIEQEQQLQELGYSHAVQLLADRKEVAIAEVELQRLKQQLADHARDFEAKLADGIRAEKQKYELELKMHQTTTTLTHKTEIATQDATIKQLRDHISVLERQITMLQADVEKQRQLTQHVAESARPQLYGGGNGNGGSSSSR